jgi:hypothetical protein
MKSVGSVKDSMIFELRVDKKYIVVLERCTKMLSYGLLRWPVFGACALCDQIVIPKSYSVVSTTREQF